MNQLPPSVNPSASSHSVDVVPSLAAPLWVVPVCIAVSMSGYAVLRYVVFKGVSVDHAPLYLTNKVLGFTGLSLIALALNAHRFTGEVISADVRGRFWGQLGLALTSAHAVASALLVRPAYFADWFLADGTLTWRAEASLVLGVGGLIALGWLARRPPTLRLLAAGVLVLSGLHAFFLGFAGWLEPGRWPGYLPPITLLSATVALFGLWALPNRAE